MATVNTSPTKPSLRRRRWFRVLLVPAVLLLFVLAWFILSRVTAPWTSIRFGEVKGVAAGAPAEEPASLRILCYNIAHGRGADTTSNFEGGTAEERLQRLHDIAVYLREENADVVVLNEVDFRTSWSHNTNQAEFLAREAVYQYWLEQAHYIASIPFVGIRSGNAILSRFPIESAEIIDYPGPYPWRTLVVGHKQGALCSIQISPSRSIQVIPIHLNPRQENLKVESARILLRVLETTSDPLILAGDFNSTPAGFPVYEQDAAGDNAMDLLIGPEAFHTIVPSPTDETALTFHTRYRQKAIDWILGGNGVKVIDMQVPEIRWSDHYPVVAEVRLPE